MKKTEIVKCPYCGFKNRFSLTNGTKIIHCDMEEGGCDEPIVVNAKLSIVCEVRTAKIDWISN